MIFDWFQIQSEVTPVTLALSPNEIRIIKCNGNIAKLKRNDLYSFHPEYLSQLVVIGNILKLILVFLE